METNKQIFLKSILLFTMVAFFTYFIIVVLGILMNTLGFTCNCFKYVAIGIIALATAFFSYCWYNSCWKR
jgi:hypothetical protein